MIRDMLYIEQTRVLMTTFHTHRHIDDTDRELTTEEIAEVCKNANENQDSIERVLKKKVLR